MIHPTIQLATAEISAAQLLSESRVEIIPAQGPGRVIIPLGVLCLQYKYGTTPYTFDDGAFQLWIGDDTSISGDIDASDFMDSTERALELRHVKDGFIANPITEVSNLPLKMSSHGLHGGDGSILVTMAYFVITIEE